MKNIFFQLLLLFPVLLLAQADSSNGTTLEEYRFMSKGYAYQASMGIDANKEGYEIKDIVKSRNNVKFVGMYKEGVAVPQVILLIINSSAVDPVYICLPNNQANERVWDLYEMDRKAINDPEVWESYDAAMRDLTFQMMGNEPTKKETPTSYSQTSKNDDSIKVTQKDKSEQLESTDGKVIVAKGIPAKIEKMSSKDNSDAPINSKVNITMDEDIAGIGVVEAPVIRGSYSARGILVIKLCIDKNGDVSESRYTMRGSTTYKEDLKQLALESVRRAKFAPSTNNDQCGTVTFHFK